METPSVNNLRIVRLAEADVYGKSDHFNDFQSLILANESMYPSIDNWFLKKVKPGIRTTERSAFVGYIEGNPIAAAVVKKGGDSKICHLRIDEQFQNARVGEILFSLMVLEIRDFAKEVHFTLPQTLWNTKRNFFQSFAFDAATKAQRQYRLFDEELHASAPFTTVWDAASKKLNKISQQLEIGGFSLDTQLLLTIRPVFAERILSGKKSIEVRRRFSTKWLGHRINIYASAPLMSLVGQATVDRIVCAKPQEIWERFHQELGCTITEFKDYTSGADEVYAIELNDVRPFRSPISLIQISHLLNEDLRPPQSYCTLESNGKWAKGISLAAYLHGSFRTSLARFRHRVLPRPKPKTVHNPVKPLQTEMHF